MSLGLTPPPDTTPVAFMYQKMRQLIDELDGRIQTGATTCEIVNAGFGVVAVIFERPFASPPKVFVNQSSNISYYANAQSITALGCNIVVQRRDNANTTVNLGVQYLAVAS